MNKNYLRKKKINSMVHHVIVGNIANDYYIGKTEKKKMQHDIPYYNGQYHT